MLHALRDGLTFCETSGRFVFLDVRQDRYFCLGGEAETAFRDFLETAGIAGSARTPSILIKQGLLVPTAGTACIPPREQPPKARRSLLDESEGSAPRWRHLWGAAVALLSTRASLRLRGLAATLNRLKHLRQTRLRGAAEESRMREASAAFERLNLIFSPLDQCLPRSIALADMLLRAGIDARLMIGVKLRPFLAHSWVQQGDLLLNERTDVTRTFAIILVI